MSAAEATSSAPSLRPTTQASDDKSQPPNSGKIAGIAIGIIAFVAIIIALLGWRQKRKKPKMAGQPLQGRWISYDDE
ncbi:MAG: hypothetical protein M1831_007488 [Alyxoria varia]|nr:MAG: hypothetical protein M1831_007488 [Alyxoria varia]